jgi:hypothetical protein
MKKLPERTAAFSRFFALSLSSTFVLFLSLSQPHRVHHSFERHIHSHDETQGNSESHDHGGESPTQPAEPTCVVQSVTKNSQVGQVELVKLSFVESHERSLDPQKSAWVESVTFFAFLQRAPPSHPLFLSMV